MSYLVEFLRSLKRAPRSLLRTPATSIASVLTLGVAIGATTAIFSVLYNVVLRPLPFRDPDQIVQINGRNADGRLLGISQVELDDWVVHAPAFESVALYGFNQYTLIGAGDADVLRGAIVSKEFFALLGASMRFGRGLTGDDDGAPHVVLAESVWRQRFGADSSIIGRALNLNGQPYTVVGVADAGFRFPADDVALWTGLGYARTTAPPQWKMRGFRQFSLLGRIRSTASLAEARAQADDLAASLAKTYPRFNGDIGVVLTPLQERVVGPVQNALLMLFGAVTLVLLVACGNLANLSFTRAASRQREMAIRSAAGASRGQLVASALAESTVLAIAGAALGVFIAATTVAALLPFIPADSPRTSEIRIDEISLAFSLGAALLSVTFFGLWPALWASSRPAGAALRELRYSPGGPAIVRDGLIVAEIALAVVLLIGSGLLGQSLYNLLQTGSGARNSEALTMKLNLGPGAMGTAAAQAALIDRLIEQVARTPGVAAAGIASSLPPNVSQMRTSLTTANSAGAQVDLTVEIVAASEGVFSALGVPVLAGRTFSSSDTADSPPVVILSKAASETFFPQGDAVGRSFPAFASERSKTGPTVIGVVDEVRFAGLEAPATGALYVPHAQRTFRTQYLVVRVNSAAPATASTIRSAIRTVEPSLAISDVRSVADLVTAATAKSRFQAVMVVLFAALALALAVLGLYGVITHVVGQRTTELAVRLALGASRGVVLQMILQKALLLSVIGATIGVSLSYALARTIASLLYGVQPLDVPSFGLSALFVVIVSALAAIGPAHRATLVDPAVTLRAG